MGTSVPVAPDGTRSFRRFAIFGIAGTGLLAVLPDQLALVFVLYVVSNLAWVAEAIRTRQPWLLLMNVVYLSIGVLGLSRHL